MNKGKNSIRNKTKKMIKRFNKNRCVAIIFTTLKQYKKIKKQIKKPWGIIVENKTKN